ALAAACSGESDGNGSVKDLDATAGATGGGGHASGTDDASPPGSGAASDTDDASPRGSGGVKGGMRAVDASAGASRDSSTNADAGAPDEPDAGLVMPPPNPCAPLMFPSGITIATFRDAAMSAVYDDISDTNCYPRPVCWIDVDRLEDPRAGMTYDLEVQL